MKLVASSVLAGSLLSLLLVGGCQTGPSMSSEQHRPAISANATRRSMMAGETVLLSVHTTNLIGAKAIKWTVTPNTGKLQPQGPVGETCLFTAEQPGTYVITADAEASSGQQVSSNVSISVNSSGPTYTKE